MRLLITMFLLFSSAVSHALVIDFEEIDVGTQIFGINGESMESRGFVFTDYTYDSSGNVRISEYVEGFLPQAIDDQALYFSGNTDANSGWDGLALLTMVHTDYDPFSLNSFVSRTNTSLRILGFYDDYGDQYLYGDVYTSDLYSVDLGNGLSEYFLPESFAYINRVHIEDVREGSGPKGFLLDNVTVNAEFVPVPAAVWLFGSGLGLLGWFRRK